ncbi:hypothetical protein [Streptomyces canus]
MCTYTDFEAWSLAGRDTVAAHYGIDPLDLLAGPTRARWERLDGR